MDVTVHVGCFGHSDMCGQYELGGTDPSCYKDRRFHRDSYGNEGEIIIVEQLTED